MWVHDDRDDDIGEDLMMYIIGVMTVRSLFFKGLNPASNCGNGESRFVAPGASRYDLISGGGIADLADVAVRREEVCECLKRQDESDNAQHMQHRCLQALAERAKALLLQAEACIHHSNHRRHAAGRDVIDRGVLSVCSVL